jgi:hypothetical protein
MMDYESLSFKLMGLEVEMAEISISIEETKWFAIASAIQIQDGEGLAPTLASLQDQLRKLTKQVKDLRWYLYGEE